VCASRMLASIVHQLIADSVLGWATRARRRSRIFERVRSSSDPPRKVSVRARPRSSSRKRRRTTARLTLIHWCPCDDRSITRIGSARVGYDATHRLQQQLLDARIAGRIGDTITLSSTMLIRSAGARRRRTSSRTPPSVTRSAWRSGDGRGGDVTFHGPGQLVAYPILDLRRTAKTSVAMSATFAE